MDAKLWRMPSFQGLYEGLTTAALFSIDIPKIQFETSLVSGWEQSLAP